MLEFVRVPDLPGAVVGHVVACANQKGGVGKTTTVVNVASYLALDGLRLLIVDLDPQGNSTSGLGVDRRGLAGSVYEALMGDGDPRDFVVETKVPRLALLPSTLALAGSEVELVSAPEREHRLRSVLASLRDDFDLIIIDTPPSLGLLTVNALVAADGVLIPLQCEYYALEGLSQLITTINLVRGHLNPNLEVLGILLTMWDGRTNLASEVGNEVRRHFPDAVFDAVIPRSIRLSEAPGFGLPIALYRPDSRGATAYRSAAAELAQRLGLMDVQHPPSAGTRDDNRRSDGPAAAARRDPPSTIGREGASDASAGSVGHASAGSVRLARDRAADGPGTASHEEHRPSEGLAGVPR
jgi:chromosome partitioning protein